MADNELAGEICLGDVELSRWDQVEGGLIAGESGKRSAGNVRRERSQSLEDDVLVRRPGVGGIPVNMAAISKGYALILTNVLRLTTADRTRGT